MRVIALVSLALALAASSLPLSTRSDGGVSTTKRESTANGTLGAVGSGLGSAVNPLGNGTASASSLENGLLAGSENGGGVYKSGSSTTSGLGSIGQTRRSTTSSTPANVTGAVSQLGGEASTVSGTSATSNPIIANVTSGASLLGGGVSTGGGTSANSSSILSSVTSVVSQLVGGASTVGGTSATSNPILANVTSATSSTSNPVTRDTLRSRDDASSAGQTVSSAANVTSTAAGLPSSAENGAEGAVVGAVSGAVSSLGQSG